VRARRHAWQLAGDYIKEDVIQADIRDMSTADSGDLTAAIEAARRPLQPPAMPRAELGVRLRTSTELRGLVPTRLVLRRAAAKGGATWENPVERRRALASMNAILGGTPRASEIEQLARLRLIEEEVQRALYWQPWRTSSVAETSAANLQRALSANRRVLVSACHLGPYFLQMSAVTSLGLVPYAVAAPWFFEDPTPDYWGRRLARWWQGIAKRNERLVYSVGAFPVLNGLLEQGEVVLIYFDMPGGTRTDFLGKPVMLSSGSAKLAFNTEALVLPLRARRAGDRVWTDVFEPLDPRDFAGADELHRALAAVHERSILELPETMEDPNRAGAWENGATESEWVRRKPDGSVQPAAGPGNERSALGAS
jgi:lauroyl/myristoyl acyltransferase